MAVIQTGSIVSDIRGSVGEQTYSRNQGGLYVKTRSGPGSEPTAKQIAVTDAAADLSRYWSATLTDAQRRSWRQYAAEFPHKNQWGKASLTNGYTRFLGHNFPTYIVTSGILTADAPSGPEMSPPLFDFVIGEAADTFLVDNPTTYNPPSGSLSYQYIYRGNQVSPGVSYYSAPFQYKTANVWLYTFWLNDPLSIYAGEPCLQGNQFWLRSRLVDSTNGQISTVAIARATIGA